MDKKVELGQVVATPGALAAFPKEFLEASLGRHARGDWGDICDEDWALNEADYVSGSGQLLSSYKREDRKLWIITEWDRSVTTLLLPEER